MPEVRIPKDGVGHNNSGDILGRSGIVVSCVRETNDRLYYVVVYMLLDKFKACDLKGSDEGDTYQHLHTYAETRYNK